MRRRNIKKQDVPRFMELLSKFSEYAEGVVDEALEGAIGAIVYSEIRDDNEAADFVDSIRVKRVGGDRRAIEFSPVSSRIKAIEHGIKPFSIKDRMLSSPKAKLSKEGYAYRTIPISKDLESPPSTMKDTEVRERIREVVKGSRFAFQFASTDKDTGRFVVRDKNKEVLRKRVFKSESDYRSRKKPLSREYVIFRTMSSKPGTSSWFHPGSPGKNIVGQIEKWLQENERDIFEEFLEDLLDTHFGR